MNEGEKVPGHGVSKQVSEGEGLGGEWGREEICSFQTVPKGIVFLVRACFRSFRLRMRGFQDVLREKPSSLFRLVGYSSVFVTSLMIRSMRLNFLVRILVFYSCIQWPRLMLCSATADFSGWYRQMCR
jgi:hypothetical protein